MIVQWRKNWQFLCSDSQLLQAQSHKVLWLLIATWSRHNYVLLNYIYKGVPPSVHRKYSTKWTSIASGKNNMRNSRVLYLLWDTYVVILTRCFILCCISHTKEPQNIKTFIAFIFLMQHKIHNYFDDISNLTKEFHFGI